MGTWPYTVFCVVSVNISGELAGHKDKEHSLTSGGRGRVENCSSYLKKRGKRGREEEGRKRRKKGER
jgi:hypothetical protein